ncbi:hypothetical protein [Nocardiopsis halophila]|uniref:hypothetical protein n=1 Tax=Nocardiopsis halophila TaxID=141692 RepID=UPI0003782779|nr:hypothetical protein [Nocardiopsis halophila]
MLFIDVLEPEQWRVAAISAALLCTASFYFCVRRLLPVLIWVVFPVFLLTFPLAGLPSRHFTVNETFYAFTFLFTSFAVVLAGLRPDMRRAQEKHAVGETYAIPKWKGYLAGAVVTVAGIIVCFPADAVTGG